MGLQRRIQMYLIGLVIGGGLAYLFYGDRLTNAKWTPTERVKLRLETTLVRATPAADSVLRAWNTSLADLRASMATADVELGSTTRSADSIYYRITAAVNGSPAEMTIVVLEKPEVDSTATLIGIRRAQ